VTPGVPEYWLGSPRFDHATLHLPNGKLLQVIAVGAGGGKKYVAGVFLNGHKIDGYKLSHWDLMTGGELIFAMKE
jgi:putative alpha-1,2-mannosidase